MRIWSLQVRAEVVFNDQIPLRVFRESKCLQLGDVDVVESVRDGMIAMRLEISLAGIRCADQSSGIVPKYIPIGHRPWTHFVFFIGRYIK